MADSTVVEKSLRSVFVGNIPYEATDEKLRDIFSQVGPVISFKLMYDRESGKPKGYGFCEYKDQETALSAMRNLNGYEIGGRPLRVDNACTEKSRMEMQSLMMGPVVESPFGPGVDPDKAPEAISNAVASLPPEQMYELMRQMKLCVRNNPAEARTMLMNNPQLAYALLQAQVVMRIIDPKMAVQILHGSRDPVEPLLPSTEESVSTKAPPPSIPPGGPIHNGGPPLTSKMPPHFPSSQNERPPPGPPSDHIPPGPRMGIPGGPPLLGGGPGPFPNQPSHPAPVPPPTRAPFSGGDYDLRQIGPLPPRGPVPQVPSGPPPSSDQDMRMPPGMGSHHSSMPPHDNYRPPPHDSGRFGRDYDQRDRFRDGPAQPPRERESRDSYGRDNSRDNRDRDIRGNRDPRDPRAMDRERDRDRDKDYRGNSSMDSTRDPRARSFPPPPPNQDKDFRSMPANPVPPSSAPPLTRAPPTSNASSAPASSANLPAGLAGQDQEKANLIMQVLQLSDEQIRMLPPEQQTSILQLKEQIQRSAH